MAGMETGMSDPAPPSACYFRIRFLPPTICVSFLASTVTIILILFDNRNVGPDPIGLLIVRLLPIPIAGLFMGLVVLLCPIRVTSRGITYPGWRFLVRELLWEEMHSVQYVNLVGLRFLAIYRDGAATGLWLPLFINNSARFCELISIYVDDDHPLLLNLIKRCG
jgi:hypothetical protein